MRKLLRSTPFLQKARSSAPEYRPEANEQKFKDWWGRLNNLSSKPSSKVYIAQLSNLFSYYNRQVSDNTKVPLTPPSPSTSQSGRTRSLPRDSSTKSRSTTRTCPPRNTTSRECSTASSPKIPSPSTKSYLFPYQEQRNGLPHRSLADKLLPVRAVVVGSGNLWQHPRLLLPGGE